MAKIVTIPVLSSDMTSEQIKQEGLYYEEVGNLSGDPPDTKSYMAVIYNNIYLFGYNNPSAGTRTLRFLVGFRSNTILDFVANVYSVSQIEGSSVSSINTVEIPVGLQSGTEYLYFVDITPSPNRQIGFAVITEAYSSLYDAMNDMDYIGIPTKYPITYRPSNISFPDAPTEAAPGDTVIVPVSFPDGYGLANPDDLFVQCRGVLIPSTYENGQLTFTMPDPS